MKVPEEAICSICKRIFCCGKCREKHEIRNHAIRIRKKHIETLALSANNTEQLGDSIYVLCPICSNRPFPLHEVIYAELLDHIKRYHLPLHCQKCAKVYVKVDDLREFSKCLEPFTAPSNEVELNSQAIEVSSCILRTTTQLAVTQQNSISTQTSPNLANQFNGISSLTPISVVNSQWKAKVKATTTHNSISDNVCSFKNISVISNSTSLRRSIGSVTQVEVKGGKLVRTTSTPVHTDANPKPKDQTFNASGGQVSSIYNSGSDTENQNSPVTTNVAGVGGSATAYPQPEAVNLYRKFNGRTKIAAVTPLRQVMSKSIQKAFAVHGLPSFSEQKQIGSNDAVCAPSDSLLTSPLDLRLSPALRRSQSDSYCATKIQYSLRETKYQKLGAATTTLEHQNSPKRLITAAAKQLRTESIVITTKQTSSNCQATLDEFGKDATDNGSALSSVSTSSVYKTCQSFEIITSSEVDEMDDVEENDKLRELTFKSAKGNSVSNVVPITPIARLPGNSINKKAIKFETPNIENKSEKFYTPKCSPDAADDDNVPDDSSKLAVARNLSVRFSPLSRPSISECAQSTAYSHIVDAEADDGSSNDEVFLEKTDADLRTTTDCNSSSGTGSFLKSIVSSVMRLPSLTEKPNRITQRPAIHAKSKSNASIIKRCASIAGSLVRSSSSVDDQLQSLKRKRTYTIDTQLSPYRSSCHLRGTLSREAVATESVTKRFRIQGRKPIERMRNTSS